MGANQQVLNNEIEPRMRQLNEEQTLYLTFQKNQQEVDKLERIVTAARFKQNKVRSSVSASPMHGRSLLLKCYLAYYCPLQDKLEEYADQVQEADAEAARASKRLKDIEHDMGDVETNLATLRRKRDQEASGSMRELEKEVQNKSKELVTADTKAKNAADNHRQEMESKRQLVQSLEEVCSFIRGLRAACAHGGSV